MLFVQIPPLAFQMVPLTTCQEMLKAREKWDFRDLPWIELEESREDVAQKEPSERHQGRGGQQWWCHGEHNAAAHIDDRQDYDSHTEAESDHQSSLDKGTRRDFEKDGSGHRNGRQELVPEVIFIITGKR